MTSKEQVLEFFTPEKFWFELHREKDACDAIVKMEDGTVFTALFITMSYLKRQMELSYAVTRDMPHTAPVRYAGLETPQLLVNELSHDLIEDTIDNLIALDIFEVYFTRVTEHQSDGRTTSDGKLATQEVAAVVISDVLVVEE